MKAKWNLTTVHKFMCSILLSWPLWEQKVDSITKGEQWGDCDGEGRDCREWSLCSALSKAGLRCQFAVTDTVSAPRSTLWSRVFFIVLRRWQFCLAEEDLSDRLAAALVSNRPERFIPAKLIYLKVCTSGRSSQSTSTSKTSNWLMVYTVNLAQLHLM